MALLSPTPRLFRRREIVQRWLGTLAVWLLLVVHAPAVEAPAPSSEYQVKAVFLLNFAQFVEWPASTFADATSPLVIGVLGRDPFGPALEDAVLGERVNGRPFVVHRYARVEESQNCHILFISRSEAGRIPSILLTLRGKSILTVGDTDDFADRGGMIRFVMEQNKVRFRINLESAKAGNLILSSKLLRPARVTVPGKE